jgi:hypothetical protein
METSNRDKQSANADFPIADSPDPLSIVTFERVLHPLNAPSQIALTDESIQIDESDRQRLKA